MYVHLNDLGLAQAPAQSGTVERMEQEVGRILSVPAAADRWRFASALQPGDLLIRGSVPNFVNFNFQRSNKCNQFALDIAWRSGFRVPLIRRDALRVNYPICNSVVWNAERPSTENLLAGIDRTQIWGRVDTTETADQINDWLSRFQYGCIVVGWRQSGTGHVGIVRRVTAKTIDANGRITDITYDGWEASTLAGARRVTAGSSRWRTDRAHIRPTCANVAANPDCCPGGRYPPQIAFRVFSRIHIISLMPESDPLRRHVMIRAGQQCRL